MEGRQDYHDHAHAHRNLHAHSHHEGLELFCELLYLYLSMPGAKHEWGVLYFACKEKSGKRAATGDTHMAASRPTKGSTRK